MQRRVGLWQRRHGGSAEPGPPKTSVELVFADSPRQSLIKMLIARHLDEERYGTRAATSRAR